MKFSLPARAPFKFHSVVNSHGWVQLAPFRFENDVLSYVDRLSNGRVVEYQISDAKHGVQIQVKKLSKAEQKEAAEKISYMFALDSNFSAFYKAARNEPKLKKAICQAHGRVLRSPTLFEDVVKTIFTTNTLWGATKNMTQKLIASFGEPLPAALSEVEAPIKKAFPTPERIASSSPEILKETVRVGYRAPALHELAVRVVSGELNLEALKTSDLPTLELRKELLKINGVGPYAAANLLLILGRSDFIPVDSWALKLVSYEWYKGKPITAKEVEKRFEKWGEFKGFAFWFWDWKYNGS